MGFHTTAYLLYRIDFFFFFFSLSLDVIVSVTLFQEHVYGHGIRFYIVTILKITSRKVKDCQTVQGTIYNKIL